MGDLLTASSLLLAIIAMLYSVWYAEINEALHEGYKGRHREDCIEQRKRFSNTRVTRLRPLIVTSLVLVIVFLPDVIKLIFASFNTYKRYGFTVNYDAVQTAFCVVVFSKLMLFIHLVVAHNTLSQRIEKLSKRIEELSRD